MKYLCCLPVFIFTCFTASLYAQDVASREENGVVFLKTKKVLLGFDTKTGLFRLENDKNEKIVDNAYFQAEALQSKDSCEKREWSVTDVNDELGSGKTLRIRAVFSGYPDILWEATLYNEHYLTFRMGVVNDTRKPYTLQTFFPIASKQVYPGKDVRENYRILDGNGGGAPTRITDTTKLRTFNNFLIRFGRPEAPEILVGGGITYHEFEKFARIVRWRSDLSMSLYAEDPTGKLIDAGSTYFPDERFYLCFVNQNPFEALEKYSSALKKAQKIELNYYDFPTECLWYANVYSKDKNRRKFNDSPGAVEEMDNANKTGVTKYTKVGIRLVPDHYGPDNQQGWWDDEHWAKWGDKGSADAGNYAAPYLTTESWSKAVIDRGGYPFFYLQSARRSEDFVKVHPGWMLFNDPYKARIAPQRLFQEETYLSQQEDGYIKMFWSDKSMWGYDFTDTGFVRHLRNVYRNLKNAGIKGIFYDYPDITGWAYEGGFDDKYATTAYAYRRMFAIPAEELGKEVLLQERNLDRGSDVTLGVVASQRVWADANHITPEMITRCGLRWYKNRKVINYDMDSKDPSICLPANSRDGSQAMFTMSYAVSGRFLLAPSFGQLTRQQLYDLTRTFPYHSEPLSARPIDAFDQGVIYPQIYNFPINPSWSQLIFYNHNLTSHPEKNVIGVAPGKSLNEGGLGMDPGLQYHVYDFWNDRYVGLVNGNGRIEQTLRPGEARVMSVHAKKDHPQFISTNRHILQGYLDLKDVDWNSKTRKLSGVATVVENEPYTVVVAPNGFRASGVSVSAGRAVIGTDNTTGLVHLTIYSDKSADIKWQLQFAR